MVSRKKILSKSRDDINLLSNPQPEDSEDVWYQKEKLFKVNVWRIFKSCLINNLRKHQLIVTNCLTTIKNGSNNAGKNLFSNKERCFGMYILTIHQILNRPMRN